MCAGHCPVGLKPCQHLWHRVVVFKSRNPFVSRLDLGHETTNPLTDLCVSIQKVSYATVIAVLQNLPLHVSCTFRNTRFTSNTSNTLCSCHTIHACTTSRLTFSQRGGISQYLPARRPLATHFQNLVLVNPFVPSTLY